MEHIRTLIKATLFMNVQRDYFPSRLHLHPEPWERFPYQKLIEKLQTFNDTVYFENVCDSDNFCFSQRAAAEFEVNGNFLYVSDKIKV